MTGDEVPAVDAEGLHRFFHSGEEETQALRGVSLRVQRGEFVAVVGPSGSGKSTLMSCLAGLDEPDGGTVRIAGVRITRRPEPERASLRARSVGVLTQSGNLIDHLSVQQNIALARSLAGSGRDRRPDDLPVLGLDHRRHARPETLSGGETVRAGLAVALANDPAILLADEPTSKLDRGVADHVTGTLLDACDELGAALVVATHDRDVADCLDLEWPIHDGRLTTTAGDTR